MSHKLLHLLTVMCYLRISKTGHPNYVYDTDAKLFHCLHSLPSMWWEARLRCSMEEAVLMSPSNPNFVTWMNAALVDMKDLGLPLFTGINAVLSKGDYFSMEGIALSNLTSGTLKWKAQEPDNNRDRDSCILYHGANIISDGACDKPFPYMCYKKAMGGRLKCKISGYVTLAPTGQCYKFHTHVRTWSRGFMACAAEGAHLAIANSPDEAKAIKQYVWKVHGEPLAFFLGIQNRLLYGEFQTVHGQSLKLAGYEKWAQNEPNNGSLNKPEFCGGMDQNGNLHDLPCEYMGYFVCEIEGST